MRSTARMNALKSIIQGTLFPLHGRRPEPFAGIVPECVGPRTNPGRRGAQLGAVSTGPSSCARVARARAPLAYRGGGRASFLIWRHARHAADRRGAAD